MIEGDAMTETLLRELGGMICRCGREKRRGETVCRRCYYALPAPYRRALYARIGEGYEEAYQAAVAHLGSVR